jgi:opacity protein-like surface antigen
MKKIFTTIIIVFAAFTTALAQQQKGDVEFGIHAGYSYSGVSSYFGNTDLKSSFNAGVSTDFYFSNRWSLKASVIFDQKGWSNDNVTFSDSNANGLVTDYRLNYLTLPVMANWHFGKKRNWYLNFGPYAGYLISARTTSPDFDMKDIFQQVDFGLAAGIGTKFRLSDKVKLLLEYNEQTGVLHIFKAYPSSSAINVRGSFNVGLTFILK